MTSTPTPKNIRMTISVTPEVRDVFERFASAAGMSMGRAMGEWLGDTLEAVEFTAQKMEQARSAPKLVMREMHAYALGLADETGQLMDQLREKGKAERSGAARLPRPPSGNTGGNHNESTHKRQGGKS